MLMPVDHQDGPSALQQLLIAAIEGLKPGPGVSTQSNVWRTYHILLSRYVQQFQQSEVAEGLGLSLRQLRRQDGLAQRALLENLWSTYDFRSRIGELRAAPSVPVDDSPPTGPDTVTYQEELAWLGKSVPKESVHVRELTYLLMETVAPLRRTLEVRAETELAEDLPPLAVALTPTREALLALLTSAVRSVPGGTVHLTAEAQGTQVRIEIQPVPSAGDSCLIIGDQAEDAEIARELLQLSGGTLEFRPATGGVTSHGAVVMLPAGEQPVVVVVDDNRDALRLFQCYLAGSRYAFVGTPDPKEAVELAVRSEPRAIVVDVMLPEVGGWELLARLREHPKLRGVPIVVCTILPQEPLALALGAAAFLRKPVSRTELLAVLDEHLGQPCPGSG